jgi:hypothetical protein
MIEQTEMIITDWHYHAPIQSGDEKATITSHTTLDVMKKRAADKKGIACRFTCHFKVASETILTYVAEDSYVIDLADVVDIQELQKMIRNSFSKFSDKFNFRKLGTVLQETYLSPLDISKVDVDAILPLLQ